MANRKRHQKQKPVVVSAMDDEETQAAIAEVKRVEATPFGSFFYCQTCKTNLGQIMDAGQILAHLRSAHNETRPAAAILGTREMGMHLDGREWYGGTNTLTINGSGVVLTETYRYQRSEEDQAYWGLDED